MSLDKAGSSGLMTANGYIRRQWPLICTWLDPLARLYIYHARTLNQSYRDDLAEMLSQIFPMASRNLKKYAGEDFALPIVRLWLFIASDPWLYEHAQSVGSAEAKLLFSSVLIEGITNLCTDASDAERKTLACRRANRLYELHTQQFIRAAAQHIQLSVKNVQHPPTEEEDILKFITSSIFSVVCANQLCQSASVRQAFPFLQTIPVAIKIMQFLTPTFQNARNKDFELVMEFYHCVEHIALAARTPQAKAVLEVAFQHGFLDRLVDLAPWFQWASRKSANHIGKRHLSAMLENLGTWIFPHMLFLPVFRPLVRAVEDDPEKFDTADMGDLMPIWEEVMGLSALSNLYKRSIPIDLVCGWAKVSEKRGHGSWSCLHASTVSK